MLVVDPLRTHRVRQLEVQLAAGARWHDYGVVFSGPRGEPLYLLSISKQFQRRVARAGLTPIPFHGLRHSAATLLMARGMDISQIARVLGHASIRLTSNLYAHQTPEIAHRAATEMQALLGSG